MPAAVGHPGAAMVPVHGGNFGNNTETTVGALLVDAFGEGVLAAIQEIADKKTKEIVAEREKVAKAEAAAAEKEAKEAEKAADKEAHKLAPHPHAPVHHAK